MAGIATSRTARSQSRCSGRPSPAGGSSRAAERGGHYAVASRRGTGPRSLLLRTLTAPDLMTLADRLCTQEWLDGLDDSALEAVYRGDEMESAP